MSLSWFSAQIFHQASTRERCLLKLKEMKIPSVPRANSVGQNPSAKASILIPMLDDNGNASLLYTMRTPKQLSRPGQVTFPASQCEKGETPVQAALRKCKTDIGLTGNKINVWGCGPEFTGLSTNYMVVPVIGVLKRLNPNELKVDPNNISEVISISLESLCKRDNQYHTKLRNGVKLPLFRVEGYKIWGITAYFTHVILRSMLPPGVYNEDWAMKTPTALQIEHDKTFRT